MKSKLLTLGVLALLSTINYQLTAGPLGTAFTYQGRLNDGANPAQGIYNLRFALYDALSGGAQVGSTLTNSATGVTNGYFTVTLDFGAQFDGNARWLEIGARVNGGGAFTTLAPRQPLTPAPYALYAPNAGAAATANSVAAVNVTGTLGLAQLPGAVVTNTATGVNLNGSFSGNGAGITAVDAALLDGLHGSAFWKLAGNAGTTPGTAFLGTTDNQPLELKVNGMRGLRLEPGTYGAPNLIGGSPDNWVADGVMGATIAGGGAADLGGGSFSNTVASLFGTVGGGMANTIKPWTDKPAGFSTIGGGRQNEIQADVSSSTIGGGTQNTIQNDAGFATIGGGNTNTIQYAAISSTIGGGYGNTIQGWASTSTIGGGTENTIKTNARYATVPGGKGAVAASYGQQAYASGQFFSPGDAQSSLFVVRRVTFEAGPSELFLDGDNATQRMVVPTNSTWSFDVLVTGRGSGGTSAGYQIRGVIKNSGGTTALVGTVIQTLLAEENTAWDATVVADDANDALVVKVTGAAGAAILWAASVRTVEVTGF